MNLRYCTLLLLIIFAFSSGPVIAKDHYAAFNYQRSNGFPGNKVYCLFQDSHGYIWMGTENGLVCFNGYEFKTYTIQDGLPDNEVLSITEDRSGKLWLSTFSNELCYLSGGKIYSSSNDTFLSRLKFTSHVNSIVFDRWGNIWIASAEELFHISPAKKITQLDNINHDNLRSVTGIKTNDSGVALFLHHTNYYQYNKDHFELLATLPEHPFFHYNHCGFVNFSMEEFSWTPLPEFIERYKSGAGKYWHGNELNRTNCFKRVSRDLVVNATIDGAYLKDIKTGKEVARFLEGHNVSTCIVAHDGSLWFGTLGDGVYHYSRSFIQSLATSDEPVIVRFIKSVKDGLQYVANSNSLMLVKDGTQKKIQRISNGLLRYKHDKYNYMVRNRSNNWIVCLNDSIARYPNLNGQPDKRYNIGICKSIWEEGDRYLLVGTIRGLYRIDKDSFVVTDRFYDGRVTALAKVKDVICIGTLGGLLVCRPHQLPVKITAAPLNIHIHALCSQADSVLWVANNKGMLLRVISTHVTDIIDGNMGLRCNSISVLKISDQFLWIGTDNGLYAIDKHPPFKIVRHLSVVDGLNSNQVNCIAFRNGSVWAGTDKGISHFREEDIVPLKTTPVFLINSIQNGEQLILPQAGVMPLNDKTLTVHFDVIDHSGITPPGYTYRLNNNDWMESRNANLYFPTLPYGHFSLSIKAVSSNWEMPKVLTLSFYRVYPYYLRWWFIAIIIGISLGIAGLITSIFLKHARRKDREKLQVQQNLLQLEQMALQGQMNPHFIFNCITAIRQYYNQGNIAKADRFVEAFAALIRTTFEMASQTFTTLDKELDYLDKYLTIEQERFNHSFDYSIQKKTAHAAAGIPVPVMLLQPLVENAIRHGIRHLPDGTGKINIDITHVADRIYITITDNGIGREATLRMKQNFAKTTSITSTSVNKKRVELLNRLFDHRLDMRTEDMLNCNGQVAGTIIYISYPLNIYVFRP